MAETDIAIDGEQFNLVSIPNARSKLVQTAKGELLGVLDLQSLTEDLGKLGNFFRVAYNGVAGYTDIQIKVQRFGYKITELADKSAVTVHKFKGASGSVLQELKGTYEHLLNGMEEMALVTLSQLTNIAKDMAVAADKLHNDFEDATNDVKDALEDTQKAKGSEEKRKEAREKERKDFETNKLKAVEQQKHAIEAQERAKAFYKEAEMRENKAIDAQNSLLDTIANAVTGIVGAVGSAATLDFAKAVEKIRSIGDKSGHKEVIKMAHEEKKKQIEEMQKQRDLRQTAILQCLEFTEKIKNCQDDSALAEAAIEALHHSIGALKSLSTIMMKATIFWQQLQMHCECLMTENMQKKVENAMKMSKEERLKMWTNKTFKEDAMRYYSKWVALDDVCGVYMFHIKETRQDLYRYLEENPTVEHARKNVRELATTFGNNLNEAKKKLEEENKKSLEEKQDLE